MKWTHWLILLTLSAHANELCEPSGQREVQVLTLDKAPNYFFKTSADGRFLYYISEGKNRILDTKTGQEKEIFGSVDPVPSPDGEILTALDKDASGMGFNFRVTAMKEGLPVNQSPDSIALLPGTYQSIGQKNPQGRYPVMLYDPGHEKVIVFDIHRQDGRFQTSSHYRFLQAGDTPLRLPMISPDGKRFSALNTITNQTEIYEISSDSRKIKLLKTLPFAAGKASFSHDGKKITFHIARRIGMSVYNETKYPAQYDNPSEVRNIYVYDLESDAIQQVTNNLEGNSYYPIFLGDGRVAYIHKDVRSPNFVINYSTIPQGPQRSIRDVLDCLGEQGEEQIDQLARLWAAVCTSWNPFISGDEKRAGVATVLGLTRENCQLLVAKGEDPTLIQVCEALERTDKTIKPNMERPQHEGAQIATTRCLICHTGGESWLAENIKAVRKRINSTDPKLRMPWGGSPLKPEEKTKLLDYLSSLKR